MTVEDKKISGGGGGVDNIGVGMRVLAVDDNPTCLRILESMLRKCQYEVTVTNQAITALNLLRENRNKYDLVISDVNMPDMDGFKLLELVGIEMDLPVIMLSEYSDKEFVYKGVSHGAVDYLVKPVRLAELKNIWQHVFRRKKFYPKDENRSSDQEKSNDVVDESGQGVASSSCTDRNAKLNRKRKDQDEEDGDAGEENGTDNDEPGTQKKPRVVWSVELHKKFVAAVNQLGFDKAVPKKILDLMGVDGLTRENVASHLQKYRLYLKRMSSGGAPHSNMVAAYGARDCAFFRMGSMDGFGDFHTLSGPGRLSSTSLSSYVPGSTFGRLNSPGGLTLQGIANSRLLQGHSQTPSNCVNNGKFQPALLTRNPATNMLQGIPSSLEPNQLHGKSTTLVGDFSRTNDKTGFTIASSFPDARVTIGSLANTMSTASGNPLVLQVNAQQNPSQAAFGNQSSLAIPSLNQQSFEVGVSGSDFLDHGRCTENWQNAIHLSKFPSNSMPIGEHFSHEQLSTNNLRDNISSASSHIGNGPINFSASSALPASLEATIQSQAGLIGKIVQNINYTSRQRWEENFQENNPSLRNVYGNMNPLVSGNAIVGPVGQGMDQQIKYEAGQINATAPSIFQHAEIERSAVDKKMRSNEDYLLEQTKSQSGLIQNNYESLDDLMNAMIKRDPSEAMLMDGEFAFDAYSL